MAADTHSHTGSHRCVCVWGGLCLVYNTSKNRMEPQLCACPHGNIHTCQHVTSDCGSSASWSCSSDFLLTQSVAQLLIGQNYKCFLAADVHMIKVFSVKVFPGSWDFLTASP